MELQPFRQWSRENGYGRQEALAFPDCDRNLQVRIGSLLTKMAVFGGYDYDARGLGHEKLLGMRMVFLLSRAALRVHRRPVAGEVLTIDTWEDTAKGPHMRRVFEMRDSGNHLCVSAKSDWLLVDPVSRKILRPAAFAAIRTPPPCPKDIDCPDPGKIRLPRENLQDLGDRRIRWSDLDGNGHLFSGNYADIVWDALPSSLQPRGVETFAINFNREATLDQVLRLTGQESENTYRMEGTGPTGSCFTAEIVFAPEPGGDRGTAL